MSAEDQDDGETFEGVEIRVPTKRKKKQAEAAPIENDEPVPLFPNLDKDVRNVIALIRIWKRTPPGDGFKGDIPASSTLDYIAKRFGNGIYDLEAMNQDHAVLRRTQNVKIDIAFPEAQTPRPAAAPAVDLMALAERLLALQAQQFAADSQRGKDLSDKALDATKTLSTEYASMIREDSKLRVERDREFYRAQSEQTMAMMQALLLQHAQMHEQAMSSAREGFQQTMQLMQAQHQQAAAMNNPLLLISLFKEGLNLGQSTGGDDDPLSVVLRSGVQGLGHIKDMMSLQGAMTPPSLPGGKNAKRANPSSNAGGKPRTSPLTNEEMRDLIRLKKLAIANGQDFHGMVKQAQSVLGAAENGEDSEDSAEDDSPDSGEAGAPGVEGGKSSN